MYSLLTRNNNIAFQKSAKIFKQMESKTINEEVKPVNYHQIKNTPFVAVEHENKFVLVLGDTRVVKKTFDTLEQVNKYVNTKNWELLTNTMCLIADKINEFKKLKNNE